MNDPHAFFLVIEGLDGSGKSEISRRLAELMRSTLDDRVMLTFEPHDPSAAGLYIRRVLRKKIIVSSHTLALAFALNRSDHNERVIEPFLAQNTGHRVVLCDRYVLSSLVYNTSYDLPMSSVWDLNSGARRPDLTLFLDASAEICYARMGSRGGNRELFETNLADSRAHYFEAIEFLRQQGEQVLVIDANPDLLVVINSIIDALKVYGPRWLTLQKLMFLEATAPAMLAPPPLELDRWIRDFVERYTPAALADAVYDDGIRRLVAAEVNNLPLDELAALMMNFLQTDRRYRFESAWPGQPIDYTVIRPTGESGGLVILQDERRWEGVMRALESEFIAPHYSIRRDAIQFVVALDPSHAGEEVTQFVPDTGSVPVEVYGRGTLIQYFTRYITRRVSTDAAVVPPSEPPQMTMPLPEDSEIDADWSLAAALGTLAASDMSSAADDGWSQQENVDLTASGDALSADDQAVAEYAFAPLPEADESFAAYDAEPDTGGEAATQPGDYPYAPAPEAVFEDEGGALPSAFTATDEELPYDTDASDLNAWSGVPAEPQVDAIPPAPEAVFEDEGGALASEPTATDEELPYDTDASDLSAWTGVPAEPQANAVPPAPEAVFEDEGGALPSAFTATDEELPYDTYASDLSAWIETSPEPNGSEAGTEFAPSTPEAPYEADASGPGAWAGEPQQPGAGAVAPASEAEAVFEDEGGALPSDTLPQQEGAFEQPAAEPEPAPPAPDPFTSLPGPSPDDEVPWFRRARTGPLGRRDSGEHRAIAPDLNPPEPEPAPYTPPPAAPEELTYDPNAEIPWRARHRTGPLGRRETAEHKRASNLDAPSAEPAFAVDPFSAPEPLSTTGSASSEPFAFDPPHDNAGFQPEIFAAPPVSQEEMDAIAALYTGLDDALRARSAERAASATPDDESVEGEEERG